MGSFRKEFLWELVSSELVAQLSWESFVRNCEEYWIGSSVERVLWEIVSFVLVAEKREREREIWDEVCFERSVSKKNG